MKKSIVALAAGTLALGLAEFQMMGILSAVAHDLGITVVSAGHLISAYATGVCVGAPALLWLRRMKLKNVLLLLAVIIVVGNLIATLAPGYWWLLVGRFISGLPHGAYFGVGAIVARKLADKGKEVMAVSLMIAGMTVATLVGVPLGTFLSTTLTWRLAFLLVTVAGIVTLVALRRCVPDVGRLPDTGFKGQFRFLRTLPPWLIFGGVIFGQIGLYCWYSYIDPLLIHVSRFSVDDLTWLMVVAGAGMFAGNLAAGRAGVRFKPSIVAAWVMLAGALVLGLVYFLAPVRWIMVILLFFGTASLFGSGSPLQSSIVGYAKGGEMLGGTCIQIAYNAGNAIAAWLGGLLLGAGGTYTDLSLMGIPILLLGVGLLIILYFRNERGVKA